MEVRRFKKSEITPQKFIEAFNTDGYVVVEDIFEEEFVEAVKPELANAIETEAEQFHSKNHKDYGMLLACPIYGGKFLEVVEHRDFIEPFNWILGDTSIIWVYTSSGIPPNNSNHASRIHVDRSYFTPVENIDAMGSLILLDDFTIENGATYILPKSHLQAKEPTEEEFYTNAIRLVAPKGSVFYLNLRLWHAGGQNNSDKWRNALGIGMIKPYLKQRIDLPRAMEGMDLSTLTYYGKQKLGFFAQPPASVAQYYNNAKQKLIQKSEWDV